MGKKYCGNISGQYRHYRQFKRRGLTEVPNGTIDLRIQNSIKRNTLLVRNLKVRKKDNWLGVNVLFRNACIP